MRLAFTGTPAAGLASVAVLAGVLACNDTPAGPAAGGDGGAAAFSHTEAEKTKVKNLHFARVNSEGELVDGTALSATRFSEGVYILEFEPPIGHCAASASSAGFPGFDISVLRVTTQVSIGFGDGGAFDDRTVKVSLYNPTDGLSLDSSFSLVMLCP